ncbi:MAG: cytochrome c oxidase assembly protein [Gammaproteobacteria bacterium]|nr:cytochrome c oxidase assembly protein [Gammaproteobacteria bacterium]
MTTPLPPDAPVPTVSPRRHARVVGWSVLAVVGMFAFGFALVPLYEVFCEITGINGKTGGRYEASAADLQVDTSRTVEVQFTAQNGPDMPWEFHPAQRSVQVHPGQSMRVNFIARNPTDRPMVAQAVPSLSPALGTGYFHKTECFCFNRQVLQPGERIEMPLIFLVDRSIPAELYTLTLSYTLYDLTGTEAVATAPAQADPSNG